MPKEAPFDVWDGEELGLTDEVEEAAVEETAMHVDPESEVEGEGLHWSELTDGDEVIDPEAPVCCYFADEHPEPTRVTADGNGAPVDEREPDLEELLERQHYSFPSR